MEISCSGQDLVLSLLWGLASLSPTSLDILPFIYLSHWITDSIFPASFHWALQTWIGYFSSVFLHSSTSHTWLWLPATSSPLLTSGWSGRKHITWDGTCPKILVNLYFMNEDACLLKGFCPLVRGLLYTTNPSYTQGHLLVPCIPETLVCNFHIK